MSDLLDENIWFARGVFLGVMITGAILVETAVNRVGKFLAEVFYRDGQYV